MTATLAMRQVEKCYRSGLPGATSTVAALRGVDLEVGEGELLGLLGPNGAGKSTLLLCAAGLLRPDHGQIEWFGRSYGPAGRPPGIAYVPDRSVYHRFLTVREALELYATLHELTGAERAAHVAEALDRVGLMEHADKRVSQLSRGMIQRLGVAQALLGRPRLVLLDETLSGIDPVAARDIRELLGSLRDDGVTIILSSHDLGALERLASRVVVMVGGRITAAVDPATLTGGRWLVLRVDSPLDAEALLRQRRGGVLRRDDELHVPLGRQNADELLAECLALGVKVHASRVRRDDLEQHFFDLIERPVRVAEPGQ